MLLEIMDTTEGGNLLAVKDVRLVACELLLGCGSAVRRRAARCVCVVREEKLPAADVLKG